MTQQPVKRIPKWLTVDVRVILVLLVIWIWIWIWIAP
jgi:hypothetical protein